MHELAIMGRVVAALEREVEPARVRCVRLQIGELCGVLPETIRFCFGICTRGTRLDGARLEIDEVRGRGRCRRCGADVHLETCLDPCRCGSGEIEVLGGRELRVERVEVQ
ncbi:MAG TPA: hydrogenase maturation nickel metallochaperone HypA [Polyangia bacterium]|jgi:hydrogenase nickel incorporation protein HypA/HybF|nr:hydrogenase maturation nickel metallochaperone HypA [Polyangia bacterium]